MMETNEQRDERRAQYIAARSGAQRWPVDANRYRNLAKWTAESDEQAGMVLVDREATLRAMMSGLWPILGGDLFPAEAWHEVSALLSSCLTASRETHNVG